MSVAGAQRLAMTLRSDLELQSRYFDVLELLGGMGIRMKGWSASVPILESRIRALVTVLDKALVALWNAANIAEDLAGDHQAYAELVEWRAIVLEARSLIRDVGVKPRQRQQTGEEK